MTTIEELAQTIQQQHGIDSHAAARDAVLALVDQITDDPDLYNHETGHLSADGVEVVTAQIAATYATGSHSASELLVQIEEATTAADAAADTLRERTAERDELIRAALRTELRRADIAAAAGVREARLYQIRDGRR